MNQHDPDSCPRCMRDERRAALDEALARRAEVAAPCTAARGGSVAVLGIAERAAAGALLHVWPEKALSVIEVELAAAAILVNTAAALLDLNQSSPVVSNHPSCRASHFVLSTLKTLSDDLRVEIDARMIAADRSSSG